MIIITTLIYLALLFLTAFCVGMVSVWICEWRINVLYKKMRQKIKTLESLRISGALLYTKIYKIKEDYNRRILNIEKIQKLISEKIKICRESSLKNNSLKQGRPAGLLLGSRALE